MSGTTQADLPLEIWLEIFRYATYTQRSISRIHPFVPETAVTNVMGCNTPFLSMRTKCNLVLVSRSWRRVAIELLYEHITIPSLWRAKLILATLQGVLPQLTGEQTNVSNGPDNGDVNPNYGRWTRSIEVHTYARGANSVHFLEYVFRILQCCPKVRMISAYMNWSVPRDFLESLTRLWGQTLECLRWDEHTILGATWVTPEFFASFRSLRVLDIRHVAGFNSLNQSLTPPNPTMPHVTELLLSDAIPSLAVASALDLPAFYRLSLELVKPRPFTIKSELKAVANQFLKTHGLKLTQLEIISSTQLLWDGNAGLFLRLDYCPNLRDLVFHESHPLLKPIMSEPHRSLRRIGLRGVMSDRLYPDKPSHATSHLRSFMSEMFPSLEVVRTISYLVDASVDSMARDIFIWWAERFERHGIDFQDGEGVLWMYTDAVPSG